MQDILIIVHGVLQTDHSKMTINGTNNEQADFCTYDAI